MEKFQRGGGKNNGEKMELSRWEWRSEYGDIEMEKLKAEKLKWKIKVEKLKWKIKEEKLKVENESGKNEGAKKKKNWSGEMEMEK